MQRSSEFENVNIIGLMGMATFTDTISQIEKEFCSLQQIYKNHTSVSLFLPVPFKKERKYYVKKEEKE